MPDIKTIVLLLIFAGIALCGCVWAIRSGRGFKEITIFGIGKAVFGDAPKPVELPGLGRGPIKPVPRRYSKIRDVADLPSFAPVAVWLPDELMPPSSSHSYLQVAGLHRPQSFIEIPLVQEAIDDMCDYARLDETTLFDLSSFKWGLRPAPDQPPGVIRSRTPAAMRLRRRFTWTDGRPACVIDIWFPEAKSHREPQPYNAIFDQEHGWISPDTSAG